MSEASAMTKPVRSGISRRDLLSGSAALIPASAALPVSTASGATAITLDLHLTYGQSWGSNSFDSYASPFGFDPHPNLLITCRLPAAPPANAPKPCPNFLGIYIPAMPDGVTGYGPGDVFSVGRIAVIAQQELRIRNGIASPDPIMELCFCYPGETWTSGSAGGLAPGAMRFEASISGSTLTVTGAPVSGVITRGQNLSGIGDPSRHQDRSVWHGTRRHRYLRTGDQRHGVKRDVHGNRARRPLHRLGQQGNDDRHPGHLRNIVRGTGDFR